MTYENLKVETTDGVAVLTIDRPSKLNALDARTVDELDRAFAAVGSDPGVKGAVLTGSGEKAFAAGADIAELSALRPDEARSFSRRGQAVFDRIERLEKPVVAAVNGFALGGDASWRWPATCGSPRRARASAPPR
jgi:enoyl-CoA hydratase